MFKREKKKTGVYTPKLRTPTPPPPPPTSGSNAVKPPSTYSSVQKPMSLCTYETPCGWCTKWDKKCDKKIGGGNDAESRRQKDATLEDIKSGKGLPPLNTNNTRGLERIKYD